MGASGAGIWWWSGAEGRRAGGVLWSRLGELLYAGRNWTLWRSVQRATTTHLLLPPT
jgi:hypothetical protein